MTAIDDGDGDLIGGSKPKRGDGLDVFVADLGNAGSYINAVRDNQQKKTERRKDMAYYNGGRKLREADDDGQRLDENIVEHEGIGVTSQDEVDDYDDSADYDDQEVEQYRDDMDGGQDFKEYGAEHEDYDEEHCEQSVTAGDKSGLRTAATPATHAEHAEESGYAEWNAEEGECHDGENDDDMRGSR